MPQSTRSRSRVRTSPHRLESTGGFSWRTFLFGFILGIFAAVSLRAEQQLPDLSSPSQPSPPVQQQQCSVPEPCPIPICPTTVCPPPNCPTTTDCPPQNCPQITCPSVVCPQPVCPVCPPAPAAGVGEGKTQQLVTPDHVAWIAFAPSICWEQDLVREHVPRLLNDTEGRELGIFGAAHFGPPPENEEEGKADRESKSEEEYMEENYADETAKGRREAVLRHCKAQVAESAKRQMSLFAENDEAWKTEAGVMGATMTKAQREFVRAVVEAAENSAAFACMTQREKQEWAANRHKEKLDREKQKRHQEGVAKKAERKKRRAEAGWWGW